VSAEGTPPVEGSTHSSRRSPALSHLDPWQDLVAEADCPDVLAAQLAEVTDPEQRLGEHHGQLQGLGDVAPPRGCLITS
jgi:hypothetical protein